MRTGQPLLVRLASPFETDPSGQLLHHLLHRIHGLPGALAERRGPDDFVGGKTIIVLKLRRAINPLHGRERRKRHHPSHAVADENILHVIGRHAKGRVELDDNALNAIAIDEVVHIRRAEGGLQSGIDVRGRNTERVRFLFIESDFQLRGVFETLHANTANRWIFRSHFQKLISRGQ